MKNSNIKGRGLTGISILTLVTILIAVTVGLGYVFYSLYRDAEYDRAGTQMAAEVRTLVSELSRSAPLAALGDAKARDTMEQLRGRTAAIWSSVGGNLAGQLPAEQVAAFETGWTDVQHQLELVAARSQVVENFRQEVDGVLDTLPQFQLVTTNLGKTLIKAGSSFAEIDAAYSLAAAATQIESSVNALRDPQQRVADHLAALNEQRQRFAQLLDGLRNGDPALGIAVPRNSEVRYQLAATADRYRALDEAVARVSRLANDVVAAQSAADSIAGTTDRLASLADSLAEHIRALRTGGSAEILPGVSITVLAIVGVGLLVLGLAAMGFILISDARQRLRATAAANKANQDAILLLLNEIEGLAEGDLTAEATVSQDFTGAIADAINHSIQQLRELVARIEEASTDVSAASDHTRTIALELSDAAENQAREIASASAAISEMAITIDQVSANATESAAVAERSVSIAAQGASVVQNTIAGMDRIREQIQDTAKRIKRLGESSQEIGDIVSLIGDIAEQTNILALNAAIQASMAGDAGRGFAVVADEVQRLAERSAGAAKQVATLVAAIQTDTGAAVASMEQTTAEVVAGAGLSQDAGVALGQIETVSTDLAELIQDISTAARHQSSTAGHISNTMNVIQEITSRTLDQANQTATSIGELADMAVELRQSVSGFKLPDGLRTQRTARTYPAPPRRDAPETPYQATAATGAARRPGGPQPHIAAVLAESSALLAEIDEHREHQHREQEAFAVHQSTAAVAAAAPEPAVPEPPIKATAVPATAVPATTLPATAAAGMTVAVVAPPAAPMAAASKADWNPLEAELAEIDLDEFDLGDELDLGKDEFRR